MNLLNNRIRPKGRVAAITCSLALIGLALSAPSPAIADTETTTLPGGGAMSVSINTPTSGQVFSAGSNVTVSGQASVGVSAPNKDTTLVFVVDRSGSMSIDAGVDCTSAPGTETRLECVKAAVAAATAAAAAPGSAVDLVGLASFSSDQTTHDVDSASGVQVLTSPTTDSNGNGVPDLVDVSNGLVAAGNTCYSCGLSAASPIISSVLNTNAKTIMVYLSDGENNTGADVSAFGGALPDTIRAFAMGAGVSCSTAAVPASRGNLNSVAALVPGSTCQNITNFADVAGVISAAIGSSLNALTLVVDAAVTPITITPALPMQAPGSVAWTTVLTTPAIGPHTACISASGSDGFGSTNVGDCHTFIINAAPTATADDATGDEGSAILISGTASDPDTGPGLLTTTWTYAAVSGVDVGATCTFANAGSLSTSITCTDDGTYRLTLTANDGFESGVATAKLVVANVKPDITITSPAEGTLYALGTVTALTAPFTDPGSNDTHTCSVNWDDGTIDTSPATGSDCDASHTFAGAGVYTIVVTVKDDDGGSDSDTRMVVVYDPDGGFVTGGGWINSPAGAYRADPSLSGKANFGFVSKYKKGAIVPTGETEFQFHAGGFNFHSSAYEYLVVSNYKAQYRGTGTVNGASGYSFRLTAYDGNKPSSPDGVDRFRIKVTDSSNAVVYDNRLGASDDMDAADPQAISGGSIVIHK